VSAVAQAVNREPLAAIVREACELDVLAFKPGNVSVDSPGHGMTAVDFLVSAHAIALPITASRLSVGERILHAVEATQARVAQNTNLGIVLLLAPLLQAALNAAPGAALRGCVRATLDALTIEDAMLAYRAIRLAKPGGLGTSERHDVAGEPRVTLLEAMREASERDGIARQYANAYCEVFGVGAPRFRLAFERWRDAKWATLAAFLALQAALPDTLIARKRGLAGARAIAERAGALNDKMFRVVHPQTLLPELHVWDHELKQAGLNPGTSADLTVASIVAVRLEDALQG
jgi:triphosphoribosyl-dephospho-CoA synthase